MKLVCAYCGKVIRENRGGRVLDVSHGMCSACGEHFGRLWSGMPLGEYLDGLPQPVLVVTSEGRVVAANAKVAAMSGRDPSELRGLRGGEALACVQSRLPGGCGGTVHCRECAIRRAVAEVAETRRAQERVPAYVVGKGGGVTLLSLGVRPEGDLVRVTVEEIGTAEAGVA